MNQALIVVDVQNDFCEGGSLAVTGGVSVAANISDYLAAHADQYHRVIATRDWHRPGSANGGHFAPEPDYVNTWPAHCVANTTGAQFHGALDLRHIHHHIVKGWDKPAYSGFEGFIEPGWGALSGIPLERVLFLSDIEAVTIVGLATDYCVKATALDAARLGFDTTVLVDLCAAVAPDTEQVALEAFQAAGITIKESIR